MENCCLIEWVCSKERKTRYAEFQFQDQLDINYIKLIYLLTRLSYNKVITIRLLQPQSHVAPLRNIIPIQSQEVFDLTP